MSAAGLSPSLARSFSLSLSNTLICLSLSLSVFREQLTLSRLAVMEKVLQMFQLIVEQPGSASLSLLPNILGFSTQQILPLLQQQNAATDSSEITSLLYALFDR